MNSVTLMLATLFLFAVAYFSYGTYLAKKWGFDPNRQTPAHTFNDGLDYVPARAPIVFGHHFSSIVGAGPIIGPIAAAGIFGWQPVFVWVVLGCIFFGTVHDMGAIFVSIRHDGKSIADVIGTHLGRKGKLLFAAFAWLTILLVVAAFTNIVADTFVKDPTVATSSFLFIGLAMIFGFFVYRRGTSLALSTILGIIGLVICIWIGQKCPLILTAKTHMIILLGYIFVASVTPVWILLQPRDYLNSFLLYAILIGAILGVVFYAPDIKMEGFKGFTVGEGANAKYLFPFLFVTVACGSISGFHSLVGSGTTSKQLNSEKHLKTIGMGSMFIEGIVGVIALITIAFLATGQKIEGGPISIFSNGIGTFMTSLGIPYSIGKSFTALAISAFALTSLDTATRLARIILQEAILKPDENAETTKNPLANKFVTTGITVVLSGLLAFRGWKVIWPIFGSANQLLAAIALLALAVYLHKEGKKKFMIIIPMGIMFVITLSALTLLIKNNLALAAADPSKYVLIGFAAALFILAIFLIILAFGAFKTDNKLDTKEN